MKSVLCEITIEFASHPHGYWHCYYYRKVFISLGSYDHMILYPNSNFSLHLLPLKLCSQQPNGNGKRSFIVGECQRAYFETMKDLSTSKFSKMERFHMEGI
jgi:hypothetical protein